MSLCNICCNEAKKIIECSKCNEKACTECYKKYIVESKRDAQCMYCSNLFSLNFLIKSFSKDYIWSNKVGNYREHRENILYEQQLLLLPQTQIILMLEEERRNLFREKEAINIKNIDYIKEIKILMFEMCDDDTINDAKLQEYISKLTNLITLKNVLIKRKDEIYDRICVIDSDIRHKNISNEDFITRGHCPKDKCNGFIMNEWKCGLCHTKICYKCMKERSEVHECLEEDLESIKHIRNNTKPCPNCRVRVYKIEGCSQMFCVCCKIFFDWTTQAIIQNSTFIHNPHYTEYLENGGEALHRAGCVSNDDFFFLPTDIRLLIRHMQRYINELCGSYQNLDLVLDDTLLMYRKHLLLCLLDKKDFKRNIQMAYKKYQKDKEYSDILKSLSEYFTSCLYECINNIKNDKYDLNYVKCFYTRFEKYYIYSYNCIKEMLKMYNSHQQIKIGVLEGFLSDLKDIVD